MHWDVWEILALGGTPRRVVPDAADPGFTRSGDLVYEHAGAVWEASAAGENPRQIVALPSGDSFELDPRVSPDGRFVAFSLETDIGGPYRDLAVADLATGHLRRLTTTGLATSPAWEPDGRSLYFGYNGAGAVNIWRVDVSGSGLRQVTSGEGDVAALDVSADGKRIIFDTVHSGLGFGEVNLQAPLNQQSVRVLHVDPARWLWGPEYSPDGKRLAYFTALKGVISEGIGVANADGSGAVPLVEDGREDIFPQWSADGQSLVFESIHPREIREVPVAGGSPRTLYRPPAQSGYYTSVGRDGRILFMEPAAGGARLEALNPRTGNTQDLATLATGFGAELCWSPDQRQVADETPAGIALTDFHGPARQILAGRAG
ncbi:MAG: TolB family protein, partial [Terriglobales bacterium]